MMGKIFLLMFLQSSGLAFDETLFNDFTPRFVVEKFLDKDLEQSSRIAAKNEEYKQHSVRLIYDVTPTLTTRKNYHGLIKDSGNGNHEKYLVFGDEVIGSFGRGEASSRLETSREVVASVKIDDPNRALSNARVINDAMAVVASGGGGTVQLPCGRIYVGATIDNVYSRVFVRGCGADVYHDAGAPSYGTTLLSTFAGTVLRHRSVSGEAHARNTGGGFVDITVDGNGRATRLLHVTSIAMGKYHLYLKNSVGQEAALFDSLVTGKSLAESADTQFNDIRLFIRQLDGYLARSADGVVFDGSSNANFSGNKNVSIQIQHANGDAVICRNADNNVISIGAFRVGGIGKTLLGYGGSLVTGCYSNIFSTISGKGAVYLRGKSDGDESGVSNQIAWLDTANGAPAPSAGQGSSWTWAESNTGILFGFKGASAIVGSSSNEIEKSMKDRKSTTSLDIINDSQDGVRIRTSDNSVSWGISTVDQNLRIAQLSGTDGALETRQIKLRGQSINSLPKCSAEYAGTLASVYDAKDGNFNSVLVSGGRGRSLAFCDGNEWRLH